VIRFEEYFVADKAAAANKLRSIANLGVHEITLAQSVRIEDARESRVGLLKLHAPHQQDGPTSCEDDGGGTDRSLDVERQLVSVLVPPKVATSPFWLAAF